MDPFSFTDQVAIVTGATRGIGLATARMLAARGAAVAVFSRKPQACEAVVAELTAAGRRAIAVPGHAAREDDLQSLVDQTIAAFGRLDVVVANAAVNPVFDPLADLSEESWAKVIDTNLSGPLRLARLVLPHLIASSGAMVFVSSINAAVGAEGAGAYGVSKAGLEQMVRQLAVEWGPKGVRANAVAPGTTRTDMIRALTERPDFMERVLRGTPLRRVAEPEDVAAAIAFLASQAARHITGQVLTVDGGQLIRRHT